jgi:hypothetical protein
MNSVTIIETPKFSMADYDEIQWWTQDNCPTFIGVYFAPGNVNTLQWKFNSEQDAMLFVLRWT